jgi:putative flippase GtrA
VTLSPELQRFALFLCAGGSLRPQDRAIAKEYLQFGLANLVAIVQVWCVSVGLARLLFPAIGFDWHAETVARVIGVASPVYTSYLGHEHFSFGKARR